MRALQIALLLGMLLPSMARAFDYDAYKPAVLVQVAPKPEVIPDSSVVYHLDAAHSRYKSRVKFTGRIRPLKDDVRYFLSLWIKTMQHSKAYEELFQSEIEVTQGSLSYWMPIQKQLVDPFVGEVGSNGTADVYVLLIGAINREPVFAVSEFEAQETN